MAQGRVQTPELQGNIALRPAPIQSDTFVAPARPAQDNRMASLAQALGAFSTTIGQFAQTVKPSQEEEQERAAWTAQRKIEGMTHTEVREAVNSGALPVYDDKWSRQAQMAAAGLKYGADQAETLKQQLMTDFDWDNGNADAYITEAINTSLEGNQYANDPNFGPNYVRQVNSVRGWATEFQKNRKTDQFIKGQNQSAFDVIDTFFRQQADGKVDPGQIAQNIMKMYPTLGKDGTLGVDYDKLDQEVLNVARQNASTHPEAALALLSVTRKGRDGTDRSLLTNADARDTVLQIQTVARKAISENDWKLKQTEVANADYEMLRNGDMNDLEDITYTTLSGEQKTITKADRIKNASDEFLSKSGVIAGKNRESQQEKWARELRAFRNSGVTHPELEKAVGGIADMASPSLLGDPEGMEKLMGKLKTYQWMQNESKNSVMAYTKEKDRDFAEAFTLAQQYGEMNDQAALEFAIHSTQPINADGQLTLNRYRDEIDAELKKSAPTKGWFGLDSTTSAENWSQVNAKVSQLAKGFMASGGMEPSKAVKMASEAVRKHSTAYNGSLLDLQGLDVQDTFSDDVDDAIVDFIQKNPKVIERNGLEPEDISIKTLGADKSGGRFILIDKETQAPVYTDNKEVVVLTLDQLRRYGVKKKKEADNSAIRQNVFDNSAKVKGLERAVEADGTEVWVNSSTREIYDFTYPDDAQQPSWKKTGRRYKRGVMTRPDGSFVLKSFNRPGSLLKRYRDLMKSTEARDEKYAEERRKLLLDLIPSVKIGDTVIHE